ncbi:hypothetical protein R1sor_015157 [Riccia sorocarpa]|uniref:Retrotransposon gag domain-containing protein n=1 Tax=Riccia sorocarpa TaxID=122646 RepID=A0ABD3HBH0_9MARC
MEVVSTTARGWRKKGDIGNRGTSFYCKQVGYVFWKECVQISENLQEGVELNRVSEEEMIRSFELAIIPEMRNHVKTLITQAHGSWEQFSRTMKDQYFLEDEDRVTKRSFLEWVEKSDKKLSATELLREFDSRYSQLTRVEKMMLEDNKTELFLRAVDTDLQAKLEVQLEDGEVEGGLTTNWKRVEDAVGLLAKFKQRKEKGVVKRYAPTVPTIVPVAPIPVPVAQPSRLVVPRRYDPSLEEIMKGCIWCDGVDHALKECEDFVAMMRRGTIFWKDGKVALRNMGEVLATNFEKGGMKKIVEDYLAAHSVVAIETACYGLSIEDGEDFTPEGYILGIAKKEFHDIIIDIVKRKRQLTEEAAEAFAHALGAELTEDIADALAQAFGAERKGKDDADCCQQIHAKKIQRINLMSKNIYEKGRWPIDTHHNWRIKAANNTHGGLLGACSGVKLEIWNVEIE